MNELNITADNEINITTDNVLNINIDGDVKIVAPKKEYSRVLPVVGDVFERKILSEEDFQEGGIFFGYEGKEEIQDMESFYPLKWEKDETGKPFNSVKLSEEEQVSIFLEENQKQEKEQISLSMQAIISTIKKIEEIISETPVQDPEYGRLEAELENRKKQLRELEEVDGEISFNFLLEHQPEPKLFKFPQAYKPLEKKVNDKLKKSKYKFMTPQEIKNALFLVFADNEETKELYIRILFYLSKCKLSDKPILLSDRLRKLKMLSLFGNDKELIINKLNEFLACAKEMEKNVVRT
jgi:hypothetical protein